MKTLQELTTRTKTSHPINGHFKVTFFKPYSFTVAREGTSTNTQAYDRIHNTEVGIQQVMYGYTLKGAYMALYNDTQKVKN